MMGVLDPVPWCWVERLLVHQGFGTCRVYRNLPRNEGRSYWVVAILMLLRCHVFELTPMRCHSFGEVFVALLSGRSCTCASAAPKFAMVDKYSSAGICPSLFPVMQGVSRYLVWQCIEFEENQATEVLQR